jgi:hypothetical protein
MRTVMVCAAAVLVALSGVACGGAASPASPSTNPNQSTSSLSATAQPASIGLTGVVRGLNLQNGSFSLVTRNVTYVIRIDSDTQVWSRGTQVRLATLRDGTTVSIRGYDYSRYVLARMISLQ